MAAKTFVENALQSKSVNENRFDFIGRFEAQNLTIEIEFGLLAANNIFCLAESMLFAFERDVSHRYAFGHQGCKNCLCLVGRYDFIFQTLEEDHRLSEAIQMVDW